MPLSLLALALGGFCIGTTEYIVLTLLPDIARHFSVGIGGASSVISCYAVGVALGSPIMAMMLARLSNRSALLFLMLVFIGGNLMCALAPNYLFLLLARSITALAHGTFFGLGVIEATRSVREGRKASAVAFMFSGLTLANIIGVPVGVMLVRYTHWQVVFYFLALLGLLSFGLLFATLPLSLQKAVKRASLRDEFSVFKRWEVWQALFIALASSASFFSVFAYVFPILQDIAHLNASGTATTLFLVGVGFTFGNYLGGQLADKLPRWGFLGVYAAQTVANFGLLWAIHNVFMISGYLVIWGVCAFCAVPMLQSRVIQLTRMAPRLASTLNIGACNLGNALGTWMGAVFLSLGYRMQNIPILATAMSSLVFVMVVGALFQKHKPQEPLRVPAT